MSQKGDEQALRLRPVPERLKFWLDLIWEIPRDFEPPEWRIPDVSQSRDPVKEFLTSWEALISELPPATADWVRGSHRALTRETFVDAGDRYRLVANALKTLRAIASRKASPAIPQTDFEGLIEVDSEGRIRLKPSSFHGALEGVEADRIRECKNPNCGRIYWAGRADQPCCSKECANARRVRNWREKYQPVYKQNRLAKPPRRLRGSDFRDAR